MAVVVAEIPGINMEDLKIKGLRFMNWSRPPMFRFPRAGGIFIR